VWEMLGTINVDVDGVSPWLGDEARSSLRNLVMRGTGIDVPRSAAPGDTTIAPGSLGVTGLGVFVLLLLSSPGFPPPPIKWRQVEHNAEFVCS
jgi:hypothetical protein